MPAIDITLADTLIDFHAMHSMPPYLFRRFEMLITPRSALLEAIVYYGCC